VLCSLKSTLPELRPILIYTNMTYGPHGAVHAQRGPYLHSVMELTMSGLVLGTRNTKQNEQPPVAHG
jgi:hypothetical protein